MYDTIVLLGKDKLNNIEILIPKALIDSYIIHDELVSINKVIRENNEMKKEIKNPGTYVEYNSVMYIKLYCLLQEKSTFIKNKELQNFD